MREYLQDILIKGVGVLMVGRFIGEHQALDVFARAKRLPLMVKRLKSWECTLFLSGKAL